MEIAQLYKSTYNIQLQQIHISLVQEKHISNMAGEHTLAEPKLMVAP